MSRPAAVALIPARSGSKRIKDKNAKELAGHPLLAYAIRSAVDSGVFDAVICATDDQRYADIAIHYGAEVPALRPAGISGDKSPDVEWVTWILGELASRGRHFDAFSILRPTSPFRQAETIRRAWQAFLSAPHCDSLRAVCRCTEHPGKMWVLRGGYMLPLMPWTNDGTPWHSSQMAALPEVYLQDASLEFAWVRVAESGRIAGEVVVPFVSSGLDGFDINRPEDWILAEHYVREGEAQLPAIGIEAFGQIEKMG